jgi:hypothetical protein
MIPIPFKKTILGIVLLGGLGTGAVILMSSEKIPIFKLDPLTDLVYARAVDRIVAEVVVPPNKRVITIPKIEGDGMDAFRGRLQKQLNRRGGVEALVPVKNTEKKSSGWLDGKTATLLRSLAADLFTDDDEKETVPQLILAARIRDFTDQDDRVGLEVEWAEGDLSQEGALLASGIVREEIVKSVFSWDYMQVTIGQSSRFWRFVGWTLVVIAFPLLFLPMIRRVLGGDSNLHNAILLLAFSIPGILAGYVLSAFGQGFTGSSLALIGAAASIVYTYGFISLVEDAR